MIMVLSVILGVVAIGFLSRIVFYLHDLITTDRGYDGDQSEV